MLKKAFTTIALAIAMMAEALAGNITYTYADTRYRTWGTSKNNETYDVAMRIDDPALVGKKITSVSALINAVSGVSATSIWLSKDLKLDDNKVNVPDIVSIPVTLNFKGDYGEMKASLDAPYTITEEGVYIGYSFTVTELKTRTKEPILLSKYIDENGFYLHTSGTVLKWKNYVNSVPGSAVIKVTIEGDFPENALEVKSMAPIYGKAGASGTTLLEVLNVGTEPVNEVGYTYTVGNSTKTGTAKLLSPIMSDRIHSASTRLSFNLPEEIGEHAVDVVIDKINGKENAAVVGKSVSAKLFTVSNVPPRYPVLEEYTGTWCGYCTRGWFALDKMSKLHGDDFIAIVYHKRDPMSVIPVSDFPKYVSAFPAATLDRGVLLDPYYGYDEYVKVPFGIEAAWEESRMEFSPAAISLYAWWADAEHTKINATSFTSFILEENDTDYRLSYVLCADDLHSTDDAWDQENYYPEEALEHAGTELAQLCDWGDPVKDLHFNEVALASNNLMGTGGILPVDTKLNETTEDSYTFVIGNDIAPLIQNPEKLFVVAMVIDGKTGRIVNAVKAPVTMEAGIDIVERHEHTDIVAVRYTDLHGRVVNVPENGIYIKTVKYSDGTIKSEKLIVR